MLLPYPCCFRRPARLRPLCQEKPIITHALGSALAPFDASPSLLPLAARPSSRKAGSSSILSWFSSRCCPPSSFTIAGGSDYTGGGAVPAGSAAQAESGSREALSPTRRRRLCSQHGGGGGPGDGPRAGVRRRAALHQPLVHRRRRLRHGLVSVCAGLQAWPHAVTLCPQPVADLDAAAALPAPWPRVPRRPRLLASPWLALLELWGGVPEPVEA